MACHTVLQSNFFLNNYIVLEYKVPYFSHEDSDENDEEENKVVIVSDVASNDDSDEDFGDELMKSWFFLQSVFVICFILNGLVCEVCCFWSTTLRFQLK